MAKKRATSSARRQTKPDAKRKKPAKRRPTKVTTTRAKKALTECRGIVAEAAKVLGCNRTHLATVISGSEELQQVRDAAREALCDKAEKNVWDAVDAGDLKASKWILARLAKARGYTLRAEVDAKVEHSGQVILYLPDNGRDKKPGG